MYKVIHSSNKDDFAEQLNKVPTAEIIHVQFLGVPGTVVAYVALIKEPTNEG